MVSTAAQSSSESGMTKTTAGMSTTSDDHHAEHSAAADGAGGTSGTHAANPQHHQDEDYAEEEGGDSYELTTIPGRSSKTVWSEPAAHANTKSSTGTRSAAADADAADASAAHSLHSGRSLSSARSSRSISGGGGGSAKSGGRAASMLARTRLTATTSAGSCSMRSVPTSQQAKSASASGSGSGSITTRTTRARSFDQQEEDDNNNGEDILPTSSGEYYEEYSTSLNDVNDGHGNDRGGRLMDSVKLDGAQDDNEGFAAKDNHNNNNNNNSSSGADQRNSSLNEVDKARMELWGVAARNANNTSSSTGNAGTRSEEQIQVPKKQPHQAGQGTSESKDREHQQQQQVDTSRFYVSPPPEMPPPQQQQIPRQQRPQEYIPQINQLAVLFSQAQSLGKKAYDRGQQSYRNLQSLRQGYGYDGANGGRQQRDDDDNYDNHDEEAGSGGGGGGGPTTNQPEITSGFYGQSHESFFNGAAAANASSYLSDMCSLLIVLVQAPFLWLYFVVTGRDYHDRYGNVNLQQTSEGIYGGVDATTSQNTFASRTSKMSAEEKQERSEVYLEAKDEDGALFAMVSFSNGL